jgi:hypothetical protein
MAAAADRNRAWTELSVQEQLDLCAADPKYAGRLLTRSELKKEFDTFMEQTKLSWAAGNRMRSAKTEEERNVARAEMEAAQASAAAHDKHRECSVCRTWVETPPLAAVVGYVCADPLCARHVAHGKTLKALYGSAPTFADVRKEYMKHYCSGDAAWSGHCSHCDYDEHDRWYEQDDYDY